MRYRLWHLLLFIALVNVVGAPQLLRYRAQARSEACQNQLRKIGMAMMNYINLDPAGQFCSGAPDFRRFGSLDAVGWTADYSIYGQDAGVAPKAPMCPGSNVAGLTSIYDMVQLECAQVNGNWRTHPSGGVAEAERFVDVQAGPSNTFAGTAAGTPERIALISRATAKYNTNYTASWFLVDTAPTLYTVDNYPFQAFAGDEAGPRTGLRTEGPLHIRDIEMSPIVSAAIPLMADSKGVKQAPWTLRHGPLLNNGAVDPFHAGHRESSVLIRSGAMLAAPSLGRPLVQNLKTNRTSPLSNGDRVDSIMDWEDSGGRCTTGVRAIQDTTRWDTVHRDGINVLMADGSVKAVAWQAVPDSTQASNFPSGRNRDERMSSGSGAPQGEWRELPPERVFGGLFVKSYRKRIQWED